MVCCVRSGASVNELITSPLQRPVNKDYWGLFTDFSEFLPDMNITVNSEDSPMSFVSWDERERLIEAGKRGICA